MSIVQAITRPATMAEFIRARDAYQLLDVTGRVLTLQPCDQCGGEHLGAEPCHVDVRCPDCGSTRQRCLRGSEHEAAEWHRARWDEFERVVTERVAAGETRIAAPWPTEPTVDQGALF